MEDLLFVGTTGLIKAVSTFNADKDSRLAIYAVRYVENEILMLLQASRKYSKEVSLLEPIGVDKDGEAVSLVGVIEMNNRETLDTVTFRQDMKELYEAFESRLTGTEKTVLGMHYGLYRGKEHTQRETVGKLGISRSYVGRIGKKVIEKIRTEFAKHG